MKTSVFPLLAVALSASACVATVRYAPSSPGPESARRALVAERNLTHGQARIARVYDPDYAPLSFCSDQGSRVEIVETRVTDDGVCGREISRSVTAPSSTPAPERCWRYADIATIGQPRDSTAIGYFPVRGILSCPGSR
ncbi:MAG: hypothetical protein EON89_04790 [Brevundimonas sp.]|nr:MAG: hypothetical protein EON89_04790 [Brevundimonas sp.]